jgi:hypothetical protein
MSLDMNLNPTINELVGITCPKCHDDLMVVISRAQAIASEVIPLEKISEMRIELNQLINEKLPEGDHRESWLKMLNTPGFVPEPTYLRLMIAELKGELHSDVVGECVTQTPDFTEKEEAK